MVRLDALGDRSSLAAQIFSGLEWKGVGGADGGLGGEPGQLGQDSCRPYVERNYYIGGWRMSY